MCILEPSAGGMVYVRLLIFENDKEKDNHTLSFQFACFCSSRTKIFKEFITVSEIKKCSRNKNILRAGIKITFRMSTGTPARILTTLTTRLIS
jgi:hypothetical protein